MREALASDFAPPRLSQLVAGIPLHGRNPLSCPLRAHDTHHPPRLRHDEHRLRRPRCCVEEGRLHRLPRRSIHHPGPQEPGVAIVHGDSGLEQFGGRAVVDE